MELLERASQLQALNSALSQVKEDVRDASRWFMAKRGLADIARRHSSMKIKSYGSCKAHVTVIRRAY
jgi:hypothetical protein